MPKLDLDALLDQARSRSGGGGSDDPKNDMTDQEQADQLQEVLAGFTNPLPLKIGTLVRYRKDTKSYIRNGQRLHVIVGLIDPPQKMQITAENEGSPVNWRTYDAIVAVTDHSKRGSVLKYAVDSRDLELFPDGDRLVRPKN